MKNIIIFYEILPREYAACKRIKESLNKHYGYNVKIFSLVFEYFEAIKYCKKHNVEALIVPYMYHERDYMQFMPFVETNKNMKIINLYSEQIASDETLSITILRDEIAKNNVFHLCWGEYFKELLLKYDTPSSNVYVTGNARLDGALKSSYSRDDLAKKYNLDLNKKWILFAESRDWVLCEENLVSRIALGLDEELEKESFFWHKKSLETTYEELNSLTDDFFDKYEFIYRPHPGIIADVNINPKVKIITDYSIYEWLANIDIFMTATSTSIFEAEAMGLRPIVVEREDWPTTFKTYGLDEYIKIPSLLKFDEKVLEKAKNHSANNDIYIKYIGPCDGKNAERIAGEINNIVQLDFTPKYIPYNKLKLYKKRIKNFISKTLIRHGLFKKRFSNNIFYQLRNSDPKLKKNIVQFEIEGNKGN